MSLLRSNSLEETTRKRRFSFFRNKSSTSTITTGSAELSSPVSPTDSGYSSSQVDARDPERNMNISLPTSAPASPSLIRSRWTQGDDNPSSSRLSLSTNLSRPPPPLYRVPEHTLPILQHGTHEDGLPTYSSAALSAKPTTYQFIRSSPFAMIVSEDFGASRSEVPGKYHISVGVNVWMPSCTITTIRRGGSEDGHLVAELELGIMAGPATITMGGQCRSLSSVMYRKSSTSNSRTYRLLDGSSVKWKLGHDAWRASSDAQELALFDPTPPRKLILQPSAHHLTDHIIVCLVILMREHLTPKAGLVGEASQLFNYSQYFQFGEE
ncbi:hypothetical protein QCA50_002347 [Cerrena zonata]|uniref:DUF6593 domain-containing protein n=1 Tax=Cerrena zonata TaxID=2478898 RepID=A0AAW0GXT3_9APHY